MKKITNKLKSFISIIILVLTLNSCCVWDCPPPCKEIDIELNDTTSDDFKDILEKFNAVYVFEDELSDYKDNTNVYVDLSDGITRYALGNSNNKKLLEQFFFTVQNEENLNYFELSDDKIIPYNDTNALSYFTSTGHRDDNGRLKVGAPIDKAFNEIASKNELGIVITDGELYDSASQQVSMNPWASDAFKSWFASGNKLEIIYTDFNENNSGRTYKKHMYLLFFIPRGYDGNIMSALDDDFKFNNVSYKNLSFNTDVTNLYTRDYLDAQTPGGNKYLDLTKPVSSYFSAKNNFEYFSITDDYNFDFTDSGIVYLMRDYPDDDGNEFNRPIIQKLFLNLKSITNYEVDNLKINVTNVSEEFMRFKRNYYAKKNLPSILKDDNNQPILDTDNHLIFDDTNCTIIGYDEAYDTFQKNLEDTDNNFTKMLKPDYTFSKSDLKNNEINDFVFLDSEAGDTNEKNDSLEKYEVIIKFDKKFEENNLGFSNQENNIVKIDVIVDKNDFKLKTNTVPRQALTWDKIDNSGVDQTLYTSLRNVLNNNKPSPIIYTYYIEFGPLK